MKLIKKVITWLAIVGLTIPLNAMPHKAFALDTTPPTMNAAQTKTTTTINVTWSEDLSGATVNSSGNEFTVSSHTVSAASEVSPGVVRLTVSPNLSPGETPNVTFSGDIKDLNDNSATAAGPITATDGISPTLTADGSGLMYASGANSNAETLTVTFSENIVTLGSAGDYGISYDKEGNFDGINERSIVPSGVSNAGADTTVELTIPDQSLFTDAGGKFKTTVSANVKDAATNGVEQTTGNNDVISDAVTTFDATLPVVSLTTPNGGESIKGGQQYTVSWSTTDGDLPASPIELRYSADGFIANNILIAASETNDGSYVWTVPAIDSATTKVRVTTTDTQGNSGSDVSDTNFTVDSTPPLLTVSSPLDGELIATANPTATYSASDTNLAGVTVSVDDSIATAYVSGASLGTLTDGEHSLNFTATDTAGNSTSVTRAITINTDLSDVSTSTQLPANTSNAVIDDSASSGIVLDGINTTGGVTISIGEYTGVPSAASMPNVSAFGKTFEISASDPSMVTFPLTIKIYYTQTDLDDAGITEDKLDGIYFYNSVTGLFERYSDSGVDTTDVTINGVNFAGYVYANADHLTPVTAASDVTAPSTPANTTATAGDGKVTLTWDKVSDARNYTVRYRQSTNSDTTAYTYFDVDGSLTSQEISGLVNGIEYELGVSTQDRVGNRSIYSVVVATPKATAAAVVAKASSTTVQLASTPSSQIVASQPFQDQSQITNAPEIKPTENITDEGEVKGDSTQTAGSRAAVTLAILLLALAAGVGGYYGYEWWVEKRLSDGPRYIPKEEKADLTTRKKKPATKKNNRRNGRW